MLCNNTKYINIVVVMYFVLYLQCYNNLLIKNTKDYGSFNYSKEKRD